MANLDRARKLIEDVSALPETMHAVVNAGALLALDIIMLNIAESLEKITGCVTFESPTRSWIQVLNRKDEP